MKELVSSPFFGMTLTVVAYWAGVKIQKKTGLAICNSLLLTTLMMMAVLTVFGIPYDSYYVGGKFVDMILGPATACVAVSIYRKRDLLKKHLIPILAGCFAGALTGVVSVFLLCRLFGLDDTLTVTLLPKAVTTPIATALAAPYGGIVSITAVAVIFTGIMGNLLAPFLIRLFHVEDDPLAAGLAIGACSHGIGTARALELGETEGAMSGLAIGICGLMTAVLSLGFGLLM